jgi:hypothetical protein
MKAFQMSFKSQALKASRNPVSKMDRTLKGGTTSKPLDPQQLKNLARLERKRFLELQEQRRIQLEQKKEKELQELKKVEKLLERKKVKS